MKIIRNARDQIRSGKSVREEKRAEDNNRKKLEKWEKNMARK